MLQLVHDHMALSVFIVIAATLLVGELLIRTLVACFKPGFQWLITSLDEYPNFAANRISDFFDTRYDRDLGWVPKPNTTGTESIGSLGALGGHHASASFTIDRDGARTNYNHSHLLPLISVYGDSYAFCRQVNDDETWPWYLSELTKTNVLNFGVGGYGIDQAFLRLKRQYDRAPSQIVILQFVPETIARIHSVWRHYFEYGNIFAFKPRFVLSKQRLVLVPNLINGPDSLNDIGSLVGEARLKDGFYRSKFLQYEYRTPYLLSFAQHPLRHGRLLIQLSARKISNRLGIVYDGPWRTVLRDNSRTVTDMYEDHEAEELLIAIIRAFRDFSKLKRFTPVILLLPYEYDLKWHRKHGNSYYARASSRIAKIVTTLDATEVLLESDGRQLYTNEFYGNHLSAKGNKIVADFVWTALQQVESTQRSI